jgi:CHRD domain
MKGRLKLAVLVAVVAGLAVVVTTAIAGGDRDISEQLTGYEEDPQALSTTGRGTFDARISRSEERIFYRLRYADLEGNVTQAHIHFGGRAQSGGISVFLCSNLGNGPAGTQACPQAPATVSGVLEADDVIGPAAQGIAAGEFTELVNAIRSSATYANVHSSKYPGGEIRAQLDGRSAHNND